MEHMERTLYAVSGTIDGIKKLTEQFLFDRPVNLINETIVKQTKKFAIKTWEVQLSSTGDIHDGIFVELRGGRYRLLAIPTQANETLL